MGATRADPRFRVFPLARVTLVLVTAWRPFANTHMAYDAARELEMGAVGRAPTTWPTSLSEITASGAGPRKGACSG